MQAAYPPPTPGNCPHTPLIPKIHKHPNSYKKLAFLSPAQQSSLGMSECSSSSSSSSMDSAASPLSANANESVFVGKRFLVSPVNPRQEEAMVFESNVKEPNSNEGARNYEASEANSADVGDEADAKEEEESIISFRYSWPVRISERLVGADESAILNVSPPFCTAYNGVQFTWLLRICEENILDIGGYSTSNENTIKSNQFPSYGHDYDDDDGDELQAFGRKKVNITLYYKEGPARDVKLHAGNISIRNSNGLLFNELPLRELEYTKGGGWSPMIDCADGCFNTTISSGQQRKFSEFIHGHVGKQITVRVKLEMPASLFQPMQYLPSIDSPISGKLEALGSSVLNEIQTNQLKVPGVEYFDPKTDKYALYRHVYLFGCQEILRRFTESAPNMAQQNPDLSEKIGNIFAYLYFNTVIVAEAECFEDFLEALDASRHVQFPALRRECERYICAEVMAESADLTLVKKILLLAERFNLPVLKMVSFGVIVDRLLEADWKPVLEQKQQQQQHLPNILPEDCHHQNLQTHPKRQPSGEDSGAMTIESSMEEIREELLEIAEQICHPDSQGTLGNCNSTSSTSNCHNAHAHSMASANANLPKKAAVNIGGHRMAHRVHSKSLCQWAKRQTGSNECSLDEDSWDEDDVDDEDDDEDVEDEANAGGETLVGSVIAQLEELARHIRKVSMPPGVRPAPLQNGRPLSPEMTASSSTPPNGLKSIQPSHPRTTTDSGHGGSSIESRRSSLKTGRGDILLLQQKHRLDRGCNSSEEDEEYAEGREDELFEEGGEPAVYTGESESEKEADHPSAERTQLDKSANALPVARRKNAVAKLFSPERQLPEWTKFGTE